MEFTDVQMRSKKQEMLKFQSYITDLINETEKYINDNVVKNEHVIHRTIYRDDVGIPLKTYLLENNIDTFELFIKNIDLCNE